MNPARKAFLEEKRQRDKVREPLPIVSENGDKVVASVASQAVKSVVPTLVDVQLLYDVMTVAFRGFHTELENLAQSVRGIKELNARQNSLMESIGANVRVVHEALADVAKAVESIDSDDGNQVGDHPDDAPMPEKGPAE